METIKLALLIEKILGEMRDLRYSESTVLGYKYKDFSPIRKYHEEMGENFYSETLAAEYVELQRGRFVAGVISERRFRGIRRAAHILSDYSKTENPVWGRAKRTALPNSPYFKQILESFLTHLSESIADTTINGIRSTIISFLKYLEDIGCKDFHEPSLSDIRSFLIMVSGKNPRGMGNIIFALRKFWKYLKEIGATDFEAAVVLQKPAGPHIKILPCFTKEEVRTLLLHSQDGSARGSRNHAILLLAAHTGLRLIDIVNLQLGDIDWPRKEINITQRKTGNSLTLPLNIDAGNAIAEYILSFRPDTESPYVFLKTMAPFTKLSDVGTGANIIKPYLRKAGIAPSPGKGFHALRRSMGTWLIESGSDVPTTAQVLGHMNHDSSNRYVSLHHSGLRDCPMNLSGIGVAKEGLI
jgi:site-specific recombinase XerD